MEGYSGLSWVLLLAAGDALAAPPPVLAKGLGALLGAGTVLLVGARRRLSDLLAAGLLALSFPFVYHAVNGLETALAVFLVAALILVPPDSAARRAPSAGRRRQPRRDGSRAAPRRRRRGEPG